MNGWSIAFAVGCAISTVAAVLCALSAARSWRACATVATKHGLTSLHAEMAELRDSVTKLAALGKRIDSRQVMTERRASSPTPPTSSVVEFETEKDRLRALAGLTAGKPARHT